MSLVQYSDSEDESEDDSGDFDVKLPISHVERDEPYGLLVTEEDLVIIKEEPPIIDDDILDENSYIYKTEPLSPKELEKDLLENSFDNHKKDNKLHQNVHIIHTKLNNFTPPTEYEQQFQNHRKPSPPRQSSLIDNEDNNEDNNNNKNNNKQTTTTTTTTTSTIPIVDISFLPPKPKKEPDLNLQEKILKYHNMKSQNIHLNETLRNSIAFKNPTILEKLIEFCDIKEFGSNYNISEYNPYRFSSNEYYEILDKNQRKADEMREMARRNKISNTIDFVSPSTTTNNPFNILASNNNISNSNTIIPIVNNNSSNIVKKKKNKEKYKYKNQNIPQQQQSNLIHKAPPQPTQHKQKGAIISSAATTVVKKRDLETTTQSHIDSVSKRFRTNIT